MIDNDGVRDFSLRIRGGGEHALAGAAVPGATPEEAALKAARWLEPASCEEEAESGSKEMRLREKGNDRVHLYRAWAWEVNAPDDGPDWLGDSLTRTDVEEMETSAPYAD